MKLQGCLLHATMCVVAMSVTVGCRQGAAAPPTERTRPASSSRHYVARELLVKLKPDAGQALGAALTAQRTPTATGLAWFDALNQRYGVSAIRRLTVSSPSLEEIQRKYPERARRAPPGASPLRTQHVYVLVLQADVDLPRAAAVYSAQPDVEYAQPNYVAQTQPIPAPSGK